MSFSTTNTCCWISTFKSPSINLIGPVQKQH